MFVAKESHGLDPCADVVTLRGNWRKRIAPKFPSSFKYCCVHAKYFQAPSATVTQKAQSETNILLSRGIAPMNDKIVTRAKNWRSVISPSMQARLQTQCLWLLRQECQGFDLS